MYLDPLTLMVPDAFATACAAVILFVANWQFGDAPALRWWAAALLFDAVGLTLVTIGLAIKSPPALLAGVASTTLVPSLILAGVERFARHRITLAVVLAGPLLWVGALIAPLDFDHQWWATLFGFVLWWVYLPAAIWILGREVNDAAWTRYLLMGFLGVHSIVFLGATYDLVTGTLLLNEPPLVDSWFGSVLFESIFFAIGTPVAMILLCKERADKHLSEDARHDPLTGIANRRALHEGFLRLMQRCRRDGAPCSVIMFDLDHFKLINDTNGHHAGDRVLRAFADTLRTVLRPNDLFGRYGGEEFVVVLPGAAVEAAYAIAERVRTRFASDNQFLNGKRVNVTVSAGVAALEEASNDHFEAVIAAADRAMYLAKQNGRNRVERYKADQPDVEAKIVNIA